MILKIEICACSSGSFPVMKNGHVMPACILKRKMQENMQLLRVD